MDSLSKLNSNDFVTVQGQYAVINEGVGYSIVNINTKEFLARNINSFLDCIKTLEYITSKSEKLCESNVTGRVISQNKPSQLFQTPAFNVKVDVQILIEKFAPSTVRVEKKVSNNRSRYKCYDSSGTCIGRVKGVEGDRYWQPSNRDQRLY